MIWGGKMKRLLTIAVIILFIAVAVAPLFTAVNNAMNIPCNILSNGDTLYVGGSGPNNYTSIQDAIDDASDGNTVFVFNDSSPYYENIVIDKTIHLIGEDRNTTIINGRSDICINIETENVLIKEFYLMGEHRGIDSHGSNNIFSYNIVYTRFGIFVNSGCINNTISNNLLHNGITGISLDSRSNYISDNTILSHDLGGIFLEHSDYNIITRNTITNYGKAEDTVGDIYLLCSYHNIISDNILIATDDNQDRNGIKFDFDGGDCTIENNSITGYSGHGIESENGCKIQYNDLIDCVNGILINPGNNDVEYNNIINCQIGLILSQSRHNTITNNNFIDNDKHAYLNFFSFYNTWDGNYWGEPRELPYIIKGVLFVFFIPWFSVDWHPASEPYDIGG